MNSTNANTGSFRMNSEILVTGATGFVGRHLVQTLESRGYKVRALSSTYGNIARCDLPFEHVNHVFHLAAKTFVPESWESPMVFYEVNVLGTLNVLEFCRKRHASLTLLSSYVYGPPLRLPINEEHPVQAFNPYSQTKIIAEEIGRFYGQHFGVPITTIRPFNLYGPGQDSRFLIPKLVRQALDPNVKSFCIADRRPKRDYLYISDFIGLLVATLNEGTGGIYNAGSGSSISVEELAAVVNLVTAQNKPLQSENQGRPHEVPDIVADISKARADLDWFPRVSLQQGIAELVRSLQLEAK